MFLSSCIFQGPERKCDRSRRRIIPTRAEGPANPQAGQERYQDPWRRGVLRAGQPPGTVSFCGRKPV